MSHTHYRFFLAGLSVFAMLVVWLATAAYGPGLSTDGARYLSTAESLLAGRGILDYLNQPLTNWPPLYPMLLAAAGWLTGGDVFLGGQLLNILSFGLIIWLSGLLFARSLPGRGWAAAASLLVATSLPFVEVSANIASDPLFAIALLAFLLHSQDYLASRQPAALAWMVLLAIASTFLRYAGVLLIASGVVLVLLAWRPAWVRGLTQATLFGLLSSLPIGLWALLYNLPHSGTLLGTHRTAEAATNFWVLFEKIGGWFAPISWMHGPSVAVALLLGMLALVTLARQRWPALVSRLTSPAVLPALVALWVYAAILIFTISTIEHRVPGSQRLHVLLLPLLLIPVLNLLQSALPSLPPKAWGLILLLVLLLPLYRLQGYLRASLREGDVSYYNLYNTRTLRQSDIVAYLSTQPFSQDATLYSNNEAAAWFYTRHPIRRLPRYEVDLGEDADTAIQDFAGWPGSQEAVLIWFERELDYKDQVPTPDEIGKHLVLKPLFVGRYGNAYRFGD